MYLRARNAAAKAAGQKKSRSQGTNQMRNSIKIPMTLALILATIMVAAASVNYNSAAGAAALPFGALNSGEKSVRAAKGDRLDVRPEIRTIAGVTMVLRDFDRAVR